MEWIVPILCSTINELVDKFNVAYDKQNRWGGGTTFIWVVETGQNLYMDQC